MALYLEHFGLAEPPFRITPHTDFFFEGADRGATLEALEYAVLHDEGIVKVSGEVGSGKTMLCRVLMERLPEHVETIYLATASLERDEILHAIADDLELSLSRERTTVALRELHDALISRYAAGRRVVILIDEAHVMPEQTLEQVRLLSNLESNRHKLLQIVLFGQPELDATLAGPSLRQLRDRITHSFRMRPLTPREVALYLAFRMRAAGYRGPDPFSPAAARGIAQASTGLTRRINILADKALLAAFSEGTHAVTPRHVRAAVADSEFARAGARRRPAFYVGGALAAGILIGAAIQWMLAAGPPPAPQAQAPAALPRVVAPGSVVPVPAAPPAPVAEVPKVEQRKPLEEEKKVEARAEVPPPAPPPSLLTPDQLRRVGGYRPGGQRLLGERLAATRERLEQAPDERYAIELFITENVDPARMERFLVRARELVQIDDVYVIPMAGAGQYRLRVVFGEFPSRAEAAAAEKRLPPKYQKAFQTSPRSFAELRGQI